MFRNWGETNTTCCFVLRSLCNHRICDICQFVFCSVGFLFVHVCFASFGFGSSIDWGERCISDLLFLANRHVVVSYWLRLLTRFNATSIRIRITALEYKTIHSSSMFQIFYRSAMRLIVHPKCWPRAIRLAKVAFFCGCTHIQMGGGTDQIIVPIP